MHHGVNGLRSAENLGGLVVPGDPLLGEGAGFVFGVPILQRGLLSQVQHLHRRWWPTMIMLKLCRQLTASGSRCWPAGLTSEGSRGIDGDDLSCGRHGGATVPSQPSLPNPWPLRIQLDRQHGRM
jgi:hypothetical protein